MENISLVGHVAGGDASWDKNVLLIQTDNFIFWATSVGIFLFFYYVERYWKLPTAEGVRVAWNFYPRDARANLI